MTASSRLERKILDFIRRYGLVTPQDHILAAVSGGPDSVALLHVLLALRADLEWDRITVIHFDHELRGESSSGDRLFVESLAGRLGLSFLSGSGGVHALRRLRRISLEMAARARRHAFFRDALAAAGARTVALGHTSDDQAEEVLLRLIRGTGVSGLAGMSPKTDGGLIRPLLCVNKREILDYLAARGLPFRDDLSNREMFCQRNVVRHEVFPLLRERFHPRVAEVLSRHALLSMDEEDYWRTQVLGAWSSVREREDAERIVLNLSALLSLHPAMQRRVLRHAIENLQGNLLGIYFVHVESLRKWAVASAGGGMVELPAGLRAVKEGKRLVIMRAGNMPEPFVEPIPAPGRYDFPGLEIVISIREVSRELADEPPGGSATPGSPGGADTLGGPEIPGGSETLESSGVPGSFEIPANSEIWKPERGDRGLEADPSSGQVVLMDADRVLWPLVVRSWKPGDRFQPLGVGGTKKLQDFFSDAKVPRTERIRIPVLCDREKICAIPGYRLDERVKVTSETRRILVVEFSRRLTA